MHQKVFKIGLVRHILLLLLGAALLASGASYLLWRLLGSPGLPEEGTTLTVSEVYNGAKLALAAVAGVGAVVALAVAYRKQRLQEEDNRRAESNARRDDTKLYNERFKAAADQLGSEKAAVRLSGVYAFQALADDWTEGRQMCVEVLAAYLRMPFAGPLSKPSAEVSFDSKGSLSILRNPSSVEEHKGYEELQVRLTIQGVLASRLRRPRVEATPASSWIQRTTRRREPERVEYGDPAWPGISAVLTGATLVDADFHSCAFKELKCEGVVFYGKASFNNCHFSKSVDFNAAIFTSSAVFSGAVFDSYAGFCDANFIAGAYFNKAKVNHDLEFHSTRFHQAAQFNSIDGATGGTIYFTGAKFKGPTIFKGTQAFHEDAFLNTTADRKASFSHLPAPWKNVAGKLVKEAVSKDQSGTHSSPSAST